MHIKIEAVDVAGDRKIPTEMARAAGYISPLSSLEHEKLINANHSLQNTHRMAVKSIYFFREFFPRSLAIRRERYQIRPAESKSCISTCGSLSSYCSPANDAARTFVQNIVAMHTAVAARSEVPESGIIPSMPPTDMAIS
jgi:hypothetical protein